MAMNTIQDLYFSRPPIDRKDLAKNVRTAKSDLKNFKADKYKSSGYTESYKRRDELGNKAYDKLSSIGAPRFVAKAAKGITKTVHNMFNPEYQLAKRNAKVELQKSREKAMHDSNGVADSVYRAKAAQARANYKSTMLAQRDSENVIKHNEKQLRSRVVSANKVLKDYDKKHKTTTSKAGATATTKATPKATPAPAPSSTASTVVVRKKKTPAGSTTPTPAPSQSANQSTTQTQTSKSTPAPTNTQQTANQNTNQNSGTQQNANGKATPTHKNPGNPGLGPRGPKGENRPDVPANVDLDKELKAIIALARSGSQDDTKKAKSKFHKIIANYKLPDDDYKRWRNIQNVYGFSEENFSLPSVKLDEAVKRFKEGSDIAKKTTDYEKLRKMVAARIESKPERIARKELAVANEKPKKIYINGHELHMYSENENSQDTEDK